MAALAKLSGNTLYDCSLVLAFAGKPTQQHQFAVCMLGQKGFAQKTKAQRAGMHVTLGTHVLSGAEQIVIRLASLDDDLNA
ncbi:MAG: hypothetical protein AB7E52_08495 [Bdellovibrionales bacterium]